MKLHWSPRSPFVRKVMIVLSEKGLEGRVETVRSPVMMAASTNPDVLRDNPLGKIPALVLNDGTVLFDSRVICEYLDGIGDGPALLPQSFDARIECLRWQAFGDGLTDILLLWRIEMTRGAAANPVISAGFNDKVHAAMAQLEAEAATLATRPFGLGHVAIICALGQLDFRFAECNWRAAHPVLAAWHKDMSARSSVSKTAVVDDGAAEMGSVTMPLSFALDPALN